MWLNGGKEAERVITKQWESRQDFKDTKSLIIKVQLCGAAEKERKMRGLRNPNPPSLQSASRPL